MEPFSIALALAAKYAPDIIRHFGGSDQSAGVVGKVIDIAQTVTGTATPADASTVLGESAEQAAAFRAALLDADMELEKLAASDRANARAMQVAALAQDDLFSKRFVYYFASAWSLFTMFYIIAITFIPPSTESAKAIANTVLGFLLGTAVASIFSYFYGSTKGSWDKTKLLAQTGQPR